MAPSVASVLTLLVALAGAWLVIAMMRGDA